MRKYLLLLIAIAPLLSNAQYAQLQNDIDSTYVEYPFILPILGKKTVEAGFDIPYPIGFGVNSFWAKQNMLIDNLAIGFTGSNINIPLTDLTGIVKFEKVLSEVYSISVRPDVWVFPFLNVYGILGKSYATTTVKLSDPVEMESVVDLQGNTMGVGTTGAFGVGKYFVVLDGN